MVDIKGLSCIYFVQNLPIVHQYHVNPRLVPDKILIIIVLRQQELTWPDIATMLYQSCHSSVVRR